MMEDSSFTEHLEVQIIAPGAIRQMLRQGVATQDDDGRWTLRIHEGSAGIALNDTLVLSTGSGNQVRMVGTVVQVGRDYLRLDTETKEVSERRLFPRMNGGLQVRIRQATPTEIVDYLAGKDCEGNWVVADPYVDFSVEGLGIHSAQPMPARSLLLVELGVPGDPQLWRCSARLVRCSGDPEDSDFPYQVALSFLSMPPGASMALAAYTTRLQSALMAV